jgi:hypothetical protein
MALPDRSVDVLLALLEHSNVDTLLVLMRTENVLALLRLDGWSDADVRKALKVDKKIPGELILELIQRGKTAEDLLASLGPDAVAEVAAERAKSAAKSAAEASTKRAAAASAGTASKAPRAADAPGSAARAKVDASPADAPATPLTRLGVGSGRAQIAGLVLVLAAALAPAMLALFDLKIALALLGFGIAPVIGLIALGGAVGGAIAADPSAHRWVVALGGAVASAGGFAAVVGYALWSATMGRSSLLRLEIAVICMIGMLPGMIVASLIHRVVGKRA